MNAYSSRQRAFRPKAVVQKKQKIFWLRFGLIVFNFVLWIFVLSFFTHFKPLQIAEINFFGNEVVGGYYLTQTVNRELSGSYLGIFSKRNILIFPRREVGRAILKEFPRIAGVSIDRAGSAAIAIAVTERQPKFLWCAALLKVVDSECYLMDDGGLAFAVAPNFSGSTYLRYWNGEVGNLINKSFKSAFDFRELSFFIESLRGVGIIIDKVNSLSDGDVELYPQTGGKIIINNRQTLGKTFDNLVSVWTDNDLNFKKASANLDYIDLRFGNKVFYKEK